MNIIVLGGAAFLMSTMRTPRLGEAKGPVQQPRAPSEQGPLQVSGRIRRATKLSDAQSVLISYTTAALRWRLRNGDPEEGGRRTCVLLKH